MEIFSEISSHKGLTIGLSALSVAMFVGSLFAVPWVIARAPEDYFSRDDKAHRQSSSLSMKVLKNLAGLVLAGAGVLMLILPGQGIVTLIVGLALLDVPGKHALLVRMAKRPSVMRGLNYVRKKRGREPFTAPP